MYQANGLIHSDTNCYSFKKESANIFAQAKKTSEQYRLPLRFDSIARPCTYHHGL
jgi:hypothetical protein